MCYCFFATVTTLMFAALCQHFYAYHITCMRTRAERTTTAAPVYAGGWRPLQPAAAICTWHMRATHLPTAQRLVRAALINPSVFVGVATLWFWRLPANIPPRFVLTACASYRRQQQHCHVLTYQHFALPVAQRRSAMTPRCHFCMATMMTTFLCQRCCSHYGNAVLT